MQHDGPCMQVSMQKRLSCGQEALLKAADGTVE